MHLEQLLAQEEQDLMVLVAVAVVVHLQITLLAVLVVLAVQELNIQ